jgi:signal peptidase II
MTAANTEPAATAPLLQRACLLLGPALACIACDQLTKVVARATLTEGDMWSYLGDTFRLQLAYNSGAFLSLGSSMPADLRSTVFSIGVGCVLAALFVYALWAKNEPRPVTIALALVLGGGTSNLIDRLVFDGHVTDFLNLGIGWLRTGIFNVADVAISGGVVFLLWLGFRKPAQR